MKTLITQDALKARAHYDPNTGVFTGLRTGKRLMSQDTAGYLLMRVGRDTYKQHRLAFLYMTGLWPVNVVDHVNRDHRDNRWENLRDVPIQHNLQNVSRPRSTSTTGVLGAYRRSKATGFMSQIQVSGKLVPLGTFGDAKSAGAAYLAAKQKLHEGFVL